MKRVFLIFVLFLGGLTISYAADEEILFQLNNQGKDSDSYPIVGINNNEICRISCQLEGLDDNGKFSLIVSIENLDASHFICLFTLPYTEKDLRKNMRPKIVFDKGFKQPSVKTCDFFKQEGRGGILIPPGGKESFTVNRSEDDPDLEFVLPLYFAKKKGKRFILLDVRSEKIIAKVDMKPLPAYEKLYTLVNSTLDSLSKVKFVVCNHRSKKMHHPSLEDQRKSTRANLDSIKREVSHEMEKRAYGSKRYREFEKLVDRLDRFDILSIPTEDCTISDGDRTCSCPTWVTAMSLKQIHDRMEDLYLQVYNGERKKSDVIKEVETLYTHSNHIKRDPDKLKNGIARYYKGIKAL